MYCDIQSSFGKVTIQIDRVVMLGTVTGEYTLLPASKSGPPRNLEIEFQWSNGPNATQAMTIGSESIEETDGGI